MQVEDVAKGERRDGVPATKGVARSETFSVGDCLGASLFRVVDPVRLRRIKECRMRKGSNERGDEYRQ